MPYVIWFVPTNSSHVGKLRAFMDALSVRGHRIHLLSVDALQASIFEATPSIEKTGYPYESLPAGGFPGGRHWLVETLYKGRLRRVLDEFLSRRQIDALVFGEDVGSVSRMFIRLARPRGVATVMLPDGFVLPPSPHFRPGWWQTFRSWLSVIYRASLGGLGPRGTGGADRILVMNETGLEVFAAMGIERRRIRAVGSCEYDALAAHRDRPLDAREEKALRARLALPPDRPIVLFVDQGLLGDETMRSLVRTMALAAGQGEATLLVKFHPRGGHYPDTWRRWAAGAGFPPQAVVFARNECTSIEAVRLCSVCVTLYSTTALEALVYGKPLVLVQYQNVPHILRWGRQYGAALEAENPEELRRAIWSALTDQAVRERLRSGAEVAIQKELFGLDGRSADRMADCLIELIESRCKEKTE